MARFDSRLATPPTSREHSSSQTKGKEAKGAKEAQEAKEANEAIEANKIACLLLEFKNGRGKDIEAGQTLLEIREGSNEAKAANALLDMRYTDEEVDPQNVPEGVLHLRCHGKDTCFKARDGNAIREMIQERNSRELENRPGSPSDPYAGETTCRICRLDRKRTYPEDDPDVTEGEGSGADNFKARRWGAAKYDSSRYARVEFGPHGNTVVPSSSSRAQIQPTSASTTKGNRRWNQTVARQRGRTGREKAVSVQESDAPTSSRKRKQPSISVPPKNRVSKNADERGSRLRAGTCDLLHPPAQAPGSTAQAGLSARFQRELDTSLVVDPPKENIAGEEPLNGQRRSCRSKRQTLKAKESAGG